MSADIYWIPNVPGGRLAILGRPRAGDWLCDEIADWKAAGVTDVISLLQSHEARELGLTREVEIASDLGLSFEEFPIPDRGVPESVEATHGLWARIEAKIRDGGAVGVSLQSKHRARRTSGRGSPDTSGIHGS